MMMYAKILSLCVLLAHWGSVSAFSISKPLGRASSVVCSSTKPAHESGASPKAGPTGSPDFVMFPPDIPFERIEGGGTVKTYQMPIWADRAQYVIKTNGRPMKARVQFWLGPIRQVHLLEIDCEDGKQTPVQGMIKFKKEGQVLKISTDGPAELPIFAGVSVPSPERAKELWEHTEKIFDNALPEQKQLVQGGSTEGGGGSVRTWSIPNDVDAVQFVPWSKDVGKKSFRLRIEVLHGPNNKRQEFMIQCGGSTQPYHGVFQTPGNGWVIRVTNLKFLEDGLMEMAVVPYTGGVAGADMPSPARQWWDW